METVTAGIFSKFLNNVMSSFLKSLEGLFSGDAKIKIDDEKGKITVHTEQKHEVEKDGKKLQENAAVFESVITIQWPDGPNDAEQFGLTHEQALAKFNDSDKAAFKETWKEIIESAKAVRLDMAFQGKNRYQKSGFASVEALDKAIQEYKEEYDIENSATKCKNTIFFFFLEVEDQKSNSQNEDTNGENGETDSSSGDTSASTFMQFSLKKIVSRSETSIQLMKINANYNIIEAMDDVNAIVSDDTFVDQLPDNQEIFYEVTSDEDNYDVNECEDFNCIDTVELLMYDTLNVVTKLRILGMAGLRDGNNLRIDDNGIFYTFDKILMILADTVYDMGCNSLPGFEILIEEQEFTFDGSMETKAIELLQSYLDSIDIVYDCVPRGSQYKLDQHISYLEDILRGLRQTQRY